MRNLRALFRNGYVAGILVLAVVAALGWGFVVSAQDGNESSAETEPAAVEFAGSSDAPLAPGEVPQLEAQALTGDEDVAPASRVIADGVVTTYYYKRIAGPAFQPRTSTTTHAVQASGGCIYPTASAAGVFVADLDVPDGAIIDYLRVYWYDAHASLDSYAWITRYDDRGALTDLVEVKSTGSGGYGTSLGGLNHTVNTATDSLVVNWRGNVVGGDSQLCGVRVRYKIVSNVTFLPEVTK